MSDAQIQLIEVSRLRVGLYIHLDLGWMEHPFSLNSFKIRNQEQIDILRSLGVARVRYSPDKSDCLPAPDELDIDVTTKAPSWEAISPAMQAKQRRRELLANQRASLQQCERQFGEATKVFKQVLKTVHAQPANAAKLADAMMDGFIGDMLGDREAAIRLLSEKSGEESSLHAINVVVISLLLAKVVGMVGNELRDLGLGAMLHDVGKIELPDRLRWKDDHFTPAERQLYQAHVNHGVELARKMGLSTGAVLVIGQHHECVDGSGYPLHLPGTKQTMASRIVALVNQYDNLCNPANPAMSMTPHEALSVMFAQMKAHFDVTLMAAFIRMMGVYPPGSVVQLNDERFALVVSVNSARPLKPRVIIHDSEVPKDEAIVVDLEQEPDLGIQRSLKPMQLPKATYDYLSPRKRMCYFFERAREATGEGGE
ncbi:DUF3391 domain-containing protein [Chitinivorax sp. B]|uniref:HD-GYP domain-containing protein n=1 Tax=Chitinivorax sp. B TaxID=2502235 RepID=UPI0010F7BA20|nr:DUF3391 domain-containing protein [Chitinivorax sp. B]